MVVCDIKLYNNICIRILKKYSEIFEYEKGYIRPYQIFDNYLDLINKIYVDIYVELNNYKLIDQNNISKICSSILDAVLNFGLNEQIIDFVNFFSHLIDGKEFDYPELDYWIQNFYNGN